MDIGGLYASRDGRLALLEVNAFIVAAAVLALAPPVHRRAAAGRGDRGGGAAGPPPGGGHPADRHRADAGASDLRGRCGRVACCRCCACCGCGGRRLRRRASAVLGLYARVAAVLFAAITVTGVCSTLRRMPPSTVLDQLTGTAYGRMLLAKVLLVVAVAVLALLARRRLRRAAVPASAYSPARGGSRRARGGGGGVGAAHGVAAADSLVSRAGGCGCPCRAASTPRTSRNCAAMYVSMIQKSGRGACGHSATPVAMRVSESRKSAPPPAAVRPEPGRAEGHRGEQQAVARHRAAHVRRQVGPEQGDRGDQGGGVRRPPARRHRARGVPWRLKRTR